MSVEVVRAADISWNESILRLAAIHDKTVEFRYVKPDSDPAVRRFVPESVRGKAGSPDISFLGPDPDRDGSLRRYRLDRIKGDVRVVS